MDVDVTAEPAQPELVSQVTPSNPVYVPLERFEDVQQENRRLKAQLESMVSLKVYQDIMDENEELKKQLKKTQVERNQFKFRSEKYARKLKEQKNGENLSKKAKHEVCHEVLDKKLGTATVECMIKDQKKSTKWDKKGILILHMLGIYMEHRSQFYRSILFFIGHLSNSSIFVHIFQFCLPLSNVVHFVQLYNLVPFFQSILSNLNLSNFFFISRGVL